MPLFMGIDTSNYTTSAAVYDSDTKKMRTSGKLLPVKRGEAGLRQSDAVFHHVKQLPEAVSSLNADKNRILAIGASNRPRNAEGSYMPCFLCGESMADCMGSVLAVPVMKTSHQIGHILAALYSAGRLDMINSSFIAFHVSGGTTDCLYCTPDERELIKAEEAGRSLDLKAGQLIDRTGLMLGLDFPCGIQLERLAESSGSSYKTKPVIKDGSCCLSGFENKASDMIKNGASGEDTARFILDAVAETVIQMSVYARNKFGELPIIYAGGVMSDKYIARRIEKSLKNGVFFSAPEYSRDNAAGAALYSYYTYERHYK
ncbi:MAG: peptidase M22 [Ruminococcus sp.]|nr:peptidase M22 [Ruminococcus sp.]